MKCRFIQVTEGEDETRTPVTINSPDGVLPFRIRNPNTAMLSRERDPRKDMPDITYTCGDAYQKIFLFSGRKQTDKTKTCDKKN